MPGEGHLPQILKGGDGIFIDGSGAVQLSASGLSSGSLQFFPAVTKTTSSVAPVPFDSRTFVLAGPGNVMFDLIYEVLVLDIIFGVGSFMGGQFNLDVDGTPLMSVGGVYEIDLDPPPTEVATNFVAIPQKAMASALSAGTHTLHITWQAYSTGCQLSVDPNKAIVEIRRV